MAENNNLEDQLNILFDDFADEAEDTAEKAAAEAQDLAGFFSGQAEKKEESFAPDLDVSIPAFEIPEPVQEVQEKKPASFIDDTDIRPDYKEIDFDEFEDIIGEDDDEAKVSYSEPAAETVDEAEEPDDFSFDDFSLDDVVNQEEEPEETEEDDEEILPKKLEREKKAKAERPVKKETEPRSSGKKSKAEEMRQESIRFWTFTAIIALLVAAAVLFILYRRGIIGKHADEPETTAPVVTSEEQPTSEELTETEPEETTPEETTEEVTETEAESQETEAPVESEETPAETPTEPEGDANAVLNNYENLFIILDTPTLNVRKAADPESDIVGTIDEFGGGSILEQVGDWYHITSGGIDGYVNAAYVKTGDEAKQAAVQHAAKRVKITADTLNVRTEPNTEADILDVAVKGVVYDLIDEVEGFYHVKYNYMYEGYVSKDFSVIDWYLAEAIVYYPE